MFDDRAVAHARTHVRDHLRVVARPNTTYTNDDLVFLGELADRAALAIENADLFKRLAESEDKLNMAMEAGRLGVFEWDVVTGTVFWSPSLEEAHGIPKGSFEGTFDAFQRDMHPDDREQVLAAIEKVVRERTHHHIDYRIIRPDGNPLARSEREAGL